MESKFQRVIELEHRMFPDAHASQKETNSKLMSLLLEEAGELAGATRSFFGRKYRPDVEHGDIDAVQGELGDVLFVTLRLCEVWGTTPDECLDIVINKLEGRLAASNCSGDTPLTSSGHISNSDIV